MPYTEVVKISNSAGAGITGLTVQLRSASETVTLTDVGGGLYMTAALTGGYYTLWDNRTGSLIETAEHRQVGPARLDGIDTDIFDDSLDVSSGKVSVAFIEAGKNKFNKDTATDGYYLSGGNVLHESASYTVSDYIKVTAGQTYTATHNLRFLCYFDADKVFIDGGYTNENVTQTTAPTGAAYIRLSILLSVKASFQLEAGTTSTDYEAFELVLSYKLSSEKETSLIEKAVLAARADMIPIQNDELSLLATMKNLFDQTAAIDGYYVVKTSGNLGGGGTSNYCTSDYIPVIPDQTYTPSMQIRFMAFYDADKVFVSGGENVSQFTGVTGGAYVRFSFDSSYKAGFQIETGNYSTEYEAYRLGVPVEYLPTPGDNPEFVLPQVVPVAVGRTIELYHKQVIRGANLENYHVQVYCNIGDALGRKYRYTGVTGDIGDHALTFILCNRQGHALMDATTTIRVVAATSTATRMLCIGDSLTNSKPWLAELDSLASDAITFIGTQGTSPTLHEGRSGWSSGQFVGSGSPFWNPTTEEIDFEYYRTQNLLGDAPDIVQIYLGANDTSYADTVAEAAAYTAANLKTLVDAILADWASASVMIVLPNFWGDQEALGRYYGADGYVSHLQHKRIANIVLALMAQFEDYDSDVSVVPVAQTMDADYAFFADTPATDTVNPRSSITIAVPSRDIHPNTAAYLQMADIMFSKLSEIR